MYAALCALIQPGDEVICIEPFFDQYFASIHFQGGVPKFVPLHPPTGSGIKHSADWSIDMDEFRAAFTSKWVSSRSHWLPSWSFDCSLTSDRTKAVIVNTPHNPVGKVFSRKELEEIAKICVEHNVLVLADEVYDSLVYEGSEHVRIAALPGMWERTLTIGSGGSESARGCHQEE